MSNTSHQQGPRIIAIANQKGGVGKTTTTINLGAALAAQKYNVLLVDLDPQGNASTGLGVEARDREFNTYDLLLGEESLQDIVQDTDVERLKIIPATTDLSSADVELLTTKNRSQLLRKALRQRAMDAFDFDFILVDCPPSLNLLTVNAMVAAHSVLVPLQSEFFALEGLSQLVLTVREIRKVANTDLRLEGVVLTMYDKRNRLSRQVEEDARENMGDMIFKTVVPRNVRVSEAPSFGVPVIEYDPRSKGARAYVKLANELARKCDVKPGRRRG